ncbi:hypothetical protein NDU88_003992 [Pleurodeles waltl]|uniref:Myb/SANT-like DNA-binding domain-containing protein n=1 Tax=Pleurodeles waltl TaxID=8319 RepID=A0AAV7SHM3_PLEWA|nr:hypothetical protein NDU88_003992 [Pleurodeles waltl]
MVDEILKVEPQIFGAQVQHTPIARKMELWQTIVNKVNAFGNHPHIRANIRKRWNDLWGKVRSMASRHNIAVQKIGGGPPSTPPEYTNWEEKVLAILHPEGLTGLTGGLDSGTTTHATLMERPRSASAPHGDRGPTQETGEGSMDSEDYPGPSHSPRLSPSSSPTQDTTDTLTTKSPTSALAKRPHTNVSRKQTGGPQVQRPESPPTNRQDDGGPSTSGTARPVQGTQAQWARPSGRASVAQWGGQRIDAAAQEAISEVLGVYHHPQDRMGQILATLEQSQRLQIAQHQEPMEQWKQLNATMATIAGVLQHHYQIQPETPTNLEASTTGQDTDQPSTSAAAAVLVALVEDTQETRHSNGPSDQDMALEHLPRPRPPTKK